MNRASELKAVAIAGAIVISGLIAAPQRCPAEPMGSTAEGAKRASAAPTSSPLPFVDALRGNTRPRVNTGPAMLALAAVAGARTAATGGLWLSGDTAEAFEYLRWILGDQPAELLRLESGGMVSFNLRILAKAAGVASENSAEQRDRIASFVRSDEGLRLLAEVTNGPHRYLLHVGSVAPTLGGKIRFFALCNLDNRFDSRINLRRPNRQKLDKERPPEGFDSLVAINSDTRWFNLYNKQLMPMAQIVFHELAEAHARLALGLDYLPRSGKPGAHNVAIDREIRLKQERPGQLVMPIGNNLRLVSRQDWLRLNTRLRSDSESPHQSW